MMRLPILPMSPHGKYPPQTRRRMPRGMAILALVVFFSLAGVFASVMITALLRDSWQMHGAAEHYQQLRWQLRNSLHARLLADWSAWQLGSPTIRSPAHTSWSASSSDAGHILRTQSHRGLTLGQTVSWQPLMPGWPQALAVTPQGSLSVDEVAWQTATTSDVRLRAQLFGASSHIRTVLDRAQRVQESCRELPTGGGVMLIRGNCVLTATPAAAPFLLVVEGGSVALAAGSRHRGLLILLGDPQRPGFVPQLTGPGQWSGALLSDVPVSAEQVVQTIRADPEALRLLSIQPALYRLWHVAGGGYEE